MKKEYTPFGKFFSELRKQRKETLEDAAEKLGVSISYISAVEHGERPIPKNWDGLIIRNYSLSKNEEVQLHKAIFDSSGSRTITIDEVRKIMTNFVINTAQNEEERENGLRRVESILENLLNSKK